MEILYSTGTPLSPKAKELVEFDVASVRQVIAGRGGAAPRFWLADPDQYEQGGRTLRDSTSPRLLAYSPDDRILYANDGCNSCTHVLNDDVSKLSPDRIRDFAAQNRIPETLLARLVEIIRSSL